MNDHDSKLVNPGLGNLISSQPYSTNQAPAVPSLEQLAERVAKLEEYVRHMSWAEQMRR